MHDRPRAFHGSLVLTALPNLWRQFSPVPAQYVLRGPSGALVLCVCGRRPVLRLGELVTCERSRPYIPTRAGCSRVFFAGSEHVHVAFGPKSDVRAEA